MEENDYIFYYYFLRKIVLDIVLLVNFIVCFLYSLYSV